MAAEFINTRKRQIGLVIFAGESLHNALTAIIVLLNLLKEVDFGLIGGWNSYRFGLGKRCKSFERQ